MTQVHEKKKPVARKPKAEAPAEEPKQRQRRSAAQKIADLEAEIARVKEREAAKELRADPALKLTAQAVRGINKALEAAEDEELAGALTAAKAAIAEYLEGKGLRVPQPGKKRKRTAEAA